MGRAGVDILLLQEINIKKAASSSFISKVKWVGWQAFVSSSSSEDARGGTAVLLIWGECEHVSNATAVADNAHGDCLAGGACVVDAQLGAHQVRLASVYMYQ